MKKASREGCLFGDVGAESLGLESSKGRSQQDLMVGVGVSGEA